MTGRLLKRYEGGLKSLIKMKEGIRFSAKKQFIFQQSLLTPYLIARFSNFSILPNKTISPTLQNRRLLHR